MIDGLEALVGGLMVICGVECVGKVGTGKYPDNPSSTVEDTTESQPRLKPFLDWSACLGDCVEAKLEAIGISVPD